MPEAGDENRTSREVVCTLRRAGSHHHPVNPARPFRLEQERSRLQHWRRGLVLSEQLTIVLHGISIPRNRRRPLNRSGSPPALNRGSIVRRKSAPPPVL